VQSTLRYLSSAKDKLINSAPLRSIFTRTIRGIFNGTQRHEDTKISTYSSFCRMISRSRLNLTGVGMPWRQTAIGLVATCVGWVDNSVNKVNMPVVTHQHIAFYSIKDVVLTISIIFAIVFWMKA
jgi:hypothetical protein